MSSIFPIRDAVTLDDREPRLVDLDEETADEVFETLASTTTRKIFLELHRSPQTASDLAEVTETSVQNAQYHLEKLLDTDLVEVVDIWYSERGSEMKVYAPKDDSLVLFAGRDKQRTLRRLLNRVVGVFGVLVPSSVLVGLGANWWGPTADEREAPDDDAAADDPTDDATVDDSPTEDEAFLEEEPEDSPDDADKPDADVQDDVPDDGVAADDDVGEIAEGDDFDDTIEVDPTDFEYDVYANASREADAGLGMPENESAGYADDAANGVVDASDAAAAIDPLLAAGLFFLGGLVVFIALSLWQRPL